MNDTALTLAATFDRQLFWQLGGSVRYLVARLKAERREKPGLATRAPLNIALVIDASGSMRGLKLNAAKEAALGLVERLTADDHLTVVSFASEVEVHLDAVRVTPENLAWIRAEIRDLRTRGQTCLSEGWFAGIECAARAAAERPELTPRVILITDGHANMGITHHDELFQHAGQLRLRGVLTSTLGIGDDYDEQLLRGMAEHGGGRLHDAELVDEIGSVLHGELEDILLTLVEQTKVVLTAGQGVLVEVLGSATSHTKADQTSVLIGSVQEGIERVVVFKVTCPEVGSVGETLDFAVTASGHVAEDPHCHVAAGPVLLTLTSADGVENSNQLRNPATAGTAAKIWGAHMVAEAAMRNRSGAFGEAQAYLEAELRYFRRYADGLEGAEGLRQELEKLVHRIGRPTSSRSTKEMYLQSKHVTESRTDRRGLKRRWAERLDDDR